MKDIKFPSSQEDLVIATTKNFNLITNDIGIVDLLCRNSKKQYSWGYFKRQATEVLNRCSVFLFVILDVFSKYWTTIAIGGGKGLIFSVIKKPDKSIIFTGI